jgi:hypothetical protein
MRTLLLLLLLASVGCATRKSGDDDDDTAVEDCANGYDDDGDHQVDCFDPDCMALIACAPAEVCSNQTDDDRDGLVDCADPQCAGSDDCADAVETRCDDGGDDDGDQLVDCDDPDCAAATSCLPDEQEGVDCDAVCTREMQCGSDSAGPTCVSSCRCAVDEMLAPSAAEAYYDCRLSSDCAVLDGQNGCAMTLDTADVSTTGHQAISACQAHADCAGVPCELLGAFSDDRALTFTSCIDRTDCFTCLDQLSTACN